MPSRRLIILLVLLAAAFGGLFAAAPGARRHSAAGAAGGGLAAGGAAVAGAPASSAAAVAAGAPWRLDGRATLEAVRTVKLFCDLVDARRLWDAAGLFASQRIWTRTQLRSVRALSFSSARVLTAPDPATVIVVAQVEATVSPGAPVPSGATTLFFTLGRVGSTEGGWLIQAVTPRPQPPRKGSS